MRQGRFITIEGSEGAGKSTNIAVVEATLRESGIEFVSTREPGGTPRAEALRRLVLEERDEPVDPLTELLLMFAARKQHVENLIQPALAAGKWVVCDRFTDATFAYQGGGRQMPLERIATLENWIQGSLRPHLTLYFDVAPEVGASRISTRAKDRVEQESGDFFERVRNAYLQRLAANPNMHLIDASVDLEAVQMAVAEQVSAFVARTRETDQ